MNSLITSSLLAILTGSVFLAQDAIAARPAATQEQAGQGLVKIRTDYLKTVQGLVNNYRNRLEQLNKTKGSDLAIYKQVVTADTTLEKVDAAVKNLKSVTTMTAYLKGRKQVNDYLAQVKKTIDTIDKMEVKVSSLLPGKCIAFKDSKAGLQGNIQPSPAGHGKWNFQPLSGDKPYIVSQDAGWTDGNPWIPNRGVAMGYLEGNQIICIKR